MKKLYVYIVIHGNKKRNNIGIERIHDHPIQHDDVRTNLCSSNDDANVWSHAKPSDM